MIGVVAPAIAWPTTLLQPTTALICQFLGFTFLYYADSRACYKGWAPPWYGMYRFVLTFIVGASIVLSLIGRGEVTHKINPLPSAVERIQAFRDNAEEELSREMASQGQKQTQGGEGEEEED